MELLNYCISILNISIYTGLINLIVFLVFYKRLNRTERQIAHVMFLFVGSDVIATVLIFLGRQNLWIYNWILIPQLLMVTYVMVNQMQSKSIKKLLIIGGAALAAMHLINLVAFQGYINLANFTFIPSTGWMAVCSFYYLKEQLEDVNAIPFNFLLTWFALATLIDNAGSLPILTALGWTHFISEPIAYHLYDLVTWLYACWFLIILIGLLWTKTSIRSVFYSR